MIVPAFLTQIENAMATHLQNWAFNMGETNSRRLHEQMVTLADIGADGEECWFEGDPKMCVMTILSIEAARGKGRSTSSTKAGWARARRPRVTISHCMTISDTVS
jgi:hypothetical protein